MAAWAPTDSTNPTGAGSGILDQLFKTQGGQTLLQSILGGFGNLADSQRQQNMQNQQLGANAAQQQQQLAYSANQNQQQNDLTRQLALTQAAPTGWDQQYEQQQLLRNLMLQKLQNPTPTYLPQAVIDRLGSNYQPYKPTIPKEWADANVFGLDATQQALAGRQGVLDLLSQGKAPGIDFMNNGYQNANPAAAQALQDKTQGYRQYVGNDANNNLRNIQEAINLNRNPQMQGGSSGSSGGGVKGAVGGAAGGAMKGAAIGSIVPGIGTGIGAGIGALVGLFGGAKKSGGGGSSDSTQQLPNYQFMQGPQNPYAGYAQSQGQLGGGMPQQPMAPQQPMMSGGFSGLAERLRQIQAQNQQMSGSLLPYQGRG